MHLFLILCRYPFKGIASQYSFSQRLPQCYNGFRGLIESTESASAISLTPLNLLPQSHWDCWIRFRGFIETAKSASMVSLRPRKANIFRRSFVLKTTSQCTKIWLLKFFLLDSAVSLKPLKPLPRFHWNHGSGLCGLIDTAEADNLKQFSRISRRFPSHMQNGFTPWIRALGGVDWWKNPRVENLVTLSL
jgi:hypothetical protein